MTAMRAILIALFFPMLFNLLLGKYGRLLITDVLFILHIFWVTITLFINNPGQAVQQAGATGVEFIGGYLLGRAYIRSAEDFLALIKALMIISLCLLPFALMEVPTGRAILLNLLAKVPGIDVIADVATTPRFGLYRVQSVFAHPIHNGLFGTMVFALCYLGLKGVYNPMTRWMIAGAVGFGALLPLSSGAILAMMMQIFLIVWAWVLQKSKHRWLILLVVVVVLYIAVDLMSNRSPIRVFLSYATFSPGTAYHRAAIFEWGMVNVWANPISGIGLNDWVRPAWMYSPSVDNFWLLTTMQYGIPGFLFLMMGYVIGLWKIGRLSMPEGAQIWQLRRAWMFCFSGLTFTLCTVHVWHNTYSLVFFLFGAGMWLRAAAWSDATPVEEEAQDRTVPFGQSTLNTTNRSKPAYTRFPKK